MTTRFTPSNSHDDLCAHFARCGMSEREALMMTMRMEGRTTPEIATSLGLVHHQSVRNAIYHAKRILKSSGMELKRCSDCMNHDDCESYDTGADEQATICVLFTPGMEAV